MHYEDYVGFRKNLDTYAGKNVTWELLTFEHGFKTPWLGPQHAIRLYQHSANTVRVITRNEPIVFKTTTDDQGKVAFVCDSHDDWEIYRQDTRIVVSSPLRWWAFDTPDFGRTWRLVETCMHTFPFPAKLHYEGPVEHIASSLEYPDGARATFELAEGREIVGRIVLPNGMEYRLAYDAHDFPVFLEEYFPSDKVEKTLTSWTVKRRDGKLTQDITYRQRKRGLVLTRTWSWENDYLGRIRRMVTPCGREYSLDFTESLTESGDAILSVLTDLTTGAFTYMRHIGKGDLWTIERGSGYQGQTLAEAKLESRRVLQNIDHEMVTVERLDGESGRTTRTEYDRQGTPVKRRTTDADGRLLSERLPRKSEAFAYRTEPRPKSAKARWSCTRAGFTYRPDGVLRTVTFKGKTHTLAVDDLGRPRSMQVAAEPPHSWAYTPFNQIAECTDIWPRPDGSVLRRQVRYRYDEHRRIIERHYLDMEPQRYSYTCTGPQSWTSSLETWRFVHDSAGRLMQKAFTLADGRRLHGSSTVQAEAYAYRPDGRLAAMRRLTNDGQRYSAWFSYDEHGHRTIRKLEGDPPPDALERQCARLHSPISTPSHRVTMSLNSFGAVISITNHSPSTDH